MVGRKSPNSLYSERHVTFEDDAGAYDQKDAAGFIRLSLTVPDAHIDEACRRIAALAARSTMPKERRA